MSRLKLALLSLLGGFLLSLPWLGILPGWILFVAFLPLLWIEDSLSKKDAPPDVFLCYAFLAFFTWNLLSTWWIMRVSVIGMLVIVFFNALFMSLVWLLYHQFRRKIGSRLSLLALATFWLAFEYLNLNWELDWPWLTLGNGFANNVRLIQWYEYTGCLGGSLWVLLVNMFLFRIVKVNINGIGKSLYFQVAGILLLILLPSLLSYRLYNNYEESGEQVELVIIQPNIDPYTEKFGELSKEKQLDKLLKLSALEVTDSTDYLLGPETALDSIWENEKIWMDGSVRPFADFKNHFPKLKVIIGATTQKLYVEGDKMPTTVRKMNEKGKYRDVYNSAVYLESDEEVQVYHKSLLVNGVEKMPFSKYFPIVDRLFLDLGGTTGSLGTQEEPSVFKSKDGHLVGAAICYESVFGEYMSKFILRGAEAFFIISNDGWWKNTNGYKQHLSYSRLRAIECRRSIARSANTGVSAIIDQRGDLVKSTNWWEEAVLKGKLALNDRETVYVRLGDYLGRLASFVAVLLLLFLFVKGKIKTSIKNPH